VYAGSDSGLWQTPDGGVTWNKQGLAVGIPNVPVYDIQIDPTTDTTIAFTYGRGAYRLVTAATTVHPPSNLRVQSVLGSTVTVSFTPPDDGLTPTGYAAQRGLERSAVVRERVGGALRRGESAVAGRWQHGLPRVEEQRQRWSVDRAPHRHP
jgi:hypothetical protein